MKYFKITFLHKGQRKDIVLKSRNKTEAVIEAKKLYKGLLIAIKEISMPFEEKIKIFQSILKSETFNKKLDYPCYISSLKQLSVLIKAGISLKDALEDIATNTKDKLIKKIFLTATQAIDSGKSLSDVFAKYIHQLGNISLVMVKLGEQTGDLVTALENLVKICESIYENKKKISKSLRYPIINLIAIIAAFSFLVSVIVPKFEVIFERLGASLPFLTVTLLKAEHILSNYGLLILILSFSFVIAINFFYKTSIEFKRKTDFFLLKTYLVNKIILFSSLSGFLTVSASLLKNGIPLIKSLEISKDIVTNEILKNKIERIIEGINQGRNLTEMFAEQQLVNFVALRMISAGEEAGELDLMLENAASYYEEKLQNTTDNLQSAIEPIMLALIGALILWIALGTFLPMWDFANVLRNV